MNRSMNASTTRRGIVAAALLALAAPLALSAQQQPQPSRTAVDSANHHLTVKQKAKPSVLASASMRDAAFGKANRPAPSIVVAKESAKESAKPAAKSAKTSAAAASARVETPTSSAPAVPAHTETPKTKKKS